MGFMTFVKNLIVKSEGLASETRLTADVQTPRKVRVSVDSPVDRRKARKRNAKGQFIRDIRRNFQA
jgi:hypothetical protein